MKRFVALGVALSALCSVRAAAGEPDAVERTFVASCDGSTEKYIEIKPAGFRPEAGALVALHGHGSDRRQFAAHPRGECRASREAAASRGLLFVSPDYRAKTSWMGPKAESDVLDLLKKITADYGVTKFFLCGGSMGGASALTFAARHPDLVSGVVAFNPLFRRGRRAQARDGLCRVQEGL